MWARTENGLVVELTDLNPEGRYHPSLEWVECDDNVSVGWSFDGKAFQSPPTPDTETQPSRNEIEILRLHAFADPVNGSDRFFSEAQRMQIMKESGWEEVMNQGVARYREIQLQYPWST